MSSIAAMRFNSDMKAKYTELPRSGKPPKVAITTVKQKLTVLGHALLFDAWD
jgi:transposase